MKRRRRFVAILLGCAAAVAATGLGVRAFAEPYRFAGLSVISPLDCKSLFAIALLLILWIRGAGLIERPKISEASLFYLPLLLLLISAVFANNLAAPFLSDDYILVQTPFANPAQALALFLNPGGDGSFRPLGYLYFGMVRLWAAYDPLKWHLMGLGIHLANCLLLFVLVTQLWRDRRLAFLAALIFGVHGTRVEAVTWTASSFDLLATFCVLASAALFFSGAPAWIRWTSALTLAAAAIGCKESAYAYPLLLIGLVYAARRVTRETLRFVFVTLLLYGGLFTYRWRLFHGPGGYTDPATGRPQILSLQPLSTAKALLVRIWAILFFPVDWNSHLGVLVQIVIPAGCLALLILALKTTRISRRTLFGLVVSVIACMIPAANVALIGKDALGSRYLYLPAVGFCILIGMLLNAPPPANYTMADGDLLVFRI